MEKLEKINAIKTWLGSGSINLFGQPFSGKDTQGRILENVLGGTLMGGGDILRGSIIPEHVKSAMRSGKLIPSEDYVNIVLPYLSKPELTGSPLILSSVGRWHGEEEGVIQATRESGHTLKAVLYFELAEERIWTRWEQAQNKNDRGLRHDDTKEILEIRLAEFRNKTLPVVTHYKDLGKLLLIDADATPEAISEAILESLYQKTLV